MKSIYKNKRGWIKIVEAFVAMLLITGVVLMVFNKGYVKKDDGSEKIYEMELGILKEIQLDDTLRIDILNQGLVIPINSNSIGFPSAVYNKIYNNIPTSLNCEANICALQDDCILGKDIQTDVYAQSVAITATATNSSSRQLKMFCWTKGV